MQGPSFDRIARWYDQTRSLDAATASRALAALARRFPPSTFPRALELGVGTGRIAFPMATAGYHVTGVDRSGPMLERFRVREADHPALTVGAVRGDVTRLPVRDGRMDVVYWVHVLHLVPRWRRALDEALRTLRPGGLLIDIRAGSSRDIRPLSTRYDRLRRQRGLHRTTAGVRRSATILRYLNRHGADRVWSSPRWSWTETVGVGEALRHLERRVYSSMRSVSRADHRAIVRELRRWAIRTYGRLDREIEVEGGIRMTVLRKGRAPATPRRRRRAPVVARGSSSPRRDRIRRGRS